MIYTHIAAAVIAALAAWFFQDNRYTAELAELRLEHANAVIDATSTLRAEQHAITTKYQGALNAATERETISRRHLAAAARESDGLRAQLAATAVQLPSASCPSVREYGIAASTVIGECSARLVEMAEQADRAIGEVILLRDAWPSTKK